MGEYRSAAVLQHDDPDALRVARVVPASAEFVKVGKATIGYWNRPKRVRRKSYVGSVQRLSEAFSVLHDRHGGQVDTDDGESYLEAFANLVAWNERARAAMGRVEPDRQVVVDQIISTCSAWLVMVDPDAIAQAAHEVADAPKKYSADQFAKAWAITFAERTRLGLRSIGCCDLSKAKRKAASANIKKEKDRLRSADKRRAAGARPRGSSDIEFCRQHGLPYRTFKRRKADGRLEEYLAEVGLLNEWPEFVANIPMVPISATGKGQTKKLLLVGASKRAGGGRKARQPTASGLIIHIDSDALDRALDEAERQAAERAAASSHNMRVRALEVMAARLSGGRRAA
jgi:hypothetical protein